MFREVGQVCSSALRVDGSHEPPAVTDRWWQGRRGNRCPEDYRSAIGRGLRGAYREPDGSHESVPDAGTAQRAEEARPGAVPRPAGQTGVSAKLARRGDPLSPGVTGGTGRKTRGQAARARTDARSPESAVDERTDCLPSQRHGDRLADLLCGQQGQILRAGPGENQSYPREGRGTCERPAQTAQRRCRFRRAGQGVFTRSEHEGQWRSDHGRGGEGHARGGYRRCE